MTKLIAENITLKAGNNTLVGGASFTLCGGEFTVLLGPNGAGKTSLLRGAVGLAALAGGRVTLGSKDIGALPAQARAQALSYLPQIRPLAWPNRVRDIVALGRFSFGGPMGRLSSIDHAAVEEAIECCELGAMAERKADTLSGGELARVHIARALAAQAPLLIADEPVAALDPRHQFRVMDLLARYVKGGGGALAVLHDIPLAARYADRIILMDAGKIIANGPPDSVLTAENLAHVYGVKARIDGRDIRLLGPL